MWTILQMYVKCKSQYKRWLQVYALFAKNELYYNSDVQKSLKFDVLKHADYLTIGRIFRSNFLENDDISGESHI